MTQNKSNNPAGRPPKDPFSTKYLEKKELETILSEIPQDYSIQIYRMEPDWCKGLIGKLTIDSDTPIDLDYIARRYGGTKLQIRVVDGNGKWRTSKVVEISDVPKKDFNPVSPDFATPTGVRNELFKQSQVNGTMLDNTQQQQQQQVNPWLAMFPGMGGGNSNMMPPMPPKVYMKMMEKMWGFDEEEKSKKDDMSAMMQNKIMMDVMNMSSKMQMEQRSAFTEQQRSLLEMRRKFEVKNEPNEPLDQVNRTLEIVKEINGIKSALGGGDGDVKTELIQQTAGLLETGLTELIDMKKMMMQAEIAKSQPKSQTAPPPIEKRTPQQTNTPPSPQKNEALPTDPIQLAKQMRDIYMGLSSEQQQAVMTAFLSEDDQDSAKNDETVENNDNSFDDTPTNIQNINSTNDILDEEDAAVLRGESESNATDIQNGEHTGTA